MDSYFFQEYLHVSECNKADWNSILALKIFIPNHHPHLSHVTSEKYGQEKLILHKEMLKCCKNLLPILQSLKGSKIWHESFQLCASQSLNHATVLLAYLDCMILS